MNAQACMLCDALACKRKKDANLNPSIPCWVDEKKKKSLDYKT